jgi:hypothetical protein
MKYTLDHNCLLALDDDEPQADREKLMRLIRAHGTGGVEVFVPAISASELQRGGVYMTQWEDFVARMERFGVGHLPTLEPMLSWDVGFWNHALWVSDEMEVLADKIHEILFPTRAKDWAVYAKQAGADPDNLAGDTHEKWRNTLCDVQSFWSHVWHGNQVFVTNDGDFHRLTKKGPLEALSGGTIVRSSDLP